MIKMNKINNNISLQPTAIERFMNLPIIVGDYFATGEGVTMFVLFDTNIKNIDSLINSVPEYFHAALKKTTLKEAMISIEYAHIINRIAPELSRIVNGEIPLPGQLQINSKMHFCI